MELVAIGDAAFALTSHDLLTWEANADGELQEVIGGFAHDLALISNLPVAKDAPAAEQIDRRTQLEKLFGVKAPSAVDKLVEEADRDGED